MFSPLLGLKYFIFTRTVLILSFSCHFDIPDVGNVLIYRFSMF